jgi:D-sedoheptulose 7-phosphate isomerase|tara:strand:+ start:104 stop:694 length:591 start_codon:yes stop_codon:yes gene_type:complete
LNNKFIKDYFNGIEIILKDLNNNKIFEIVKFLKELRKKQGRLFIIGVGGSAANSSHAVNDFRKLCNIDASSPCDNVSEISARTNDEGWESIFVETLKVSNLGPKDAIFVLSVGGGSSEKQISINLIEAVKYSKKKKAKVLGIVGMKEGYTYKKGDIVIDVPKFDNNLITPYSESFQSIILHCIVSHPLLKFKPTKW